MKNEIKKHIDNMPDWYKELRDYKPWLKKRLINIKNGKETKNTHKEM